MAKPLRYQIISRALELIADETRWTSKVLARQADERFCAWNDPAATRFCAVGALFKAAADVTADNGKIASFAATCAKHIVRASNRRWPLQIINDREGHAVIIAMFKRTLA